MHCTFNEYKKSCSGKPKVETGGKYKCLLCMGVARIDGRGKKLNFWCMLRVVQLKKLYPTDFDPVLLWYNEEISFHMHYSTGPGNFLKLLQVLKNGMLQEKMGKNLVTNYPIFGPVELPPIWLQCNFITEIRSHRCVVCIYTSILWINVWNHSLTSKTLCPRPKMHRKVTAVETPNETYSTFCTISA